MKFFGQKDSDSELLDLDAPEDRPEDMVYDPYGLDDLEEEDVFGVSAQSFRIGPLIAGAALLCVIGAELAVCAYQAPELYTRITAPFLTGFERLGALGQSVLGGASQAAVELAQPDPEPAPEEPAPEDSQLLDNESVTPPPRPVASFEITALIEREGQELLTGGAQDIVYYNQTYEQWAEQPYGSDKLGGYGCGPTAMAMAVSSMTDAAIDPAEMAQWCVEQHYWAKKHGSYLSIVPGTAEAFGLTCTPLSPEEADADTVTRCLATGQVLVALMGPGHFTSRGHFILLRGITLDGSILVADPASVDRSLTTWDLELILDELSASRHDGAPLWILSRSLF